MFVNTAPSIEYIRAGRLRALAVTTATRSEVLPDIPTVNGFRRLGHEASGWFGRLQPDGRIGDGRSFIPVLHGL